MSKDKKSAPSDIIKKTALISLKLTVSISLMYFVLERAGIDKVFGPGTPLQDIIDYHKENCGKENRDHLEDDTGK